LYQAPVRVVSGAQVRDSLRQVAPASRQYRIKTLAGSWIPFHTGGTLARTVVCGDITLDRKHMDPALLVNTVAHENTHTVPLRSCDDERYLYTDSDYSDDIEVWLVSYGVGDLAECYRQQRGIPAAVQDCMRSMKDGTEKQGERLRLQCCACTSCAYRDAIDQLRKESGLCNETCTTRCPDPCASRSHH
jgi:predicted Zn-ribbon and HTH transcriptional regulator